MSNEGIYREIVWKSCLENYIYDLKYLPHPLTARYISVLYTWYTERKKKLFWRNSVFLHFKRVEKMFVVLCDIIYINAWGTFENVIMLKILF